MRLSLRIVPSKTDYPRLGVWIFCITWLFGNVALIIGFNGTADVPGLCGFAIACVAWWVGYAMGGTKSLIGKAIGFLVIGIWILGIFGAAVSSFHHYITDLFFWGSTAEVFLLVIAAARSGQYIIRAEKQSAFVGNTK